MCTERHSQWGQDSKTRSSRYLRSLLSYKRRKHRVSMESSTSRECKLVQTEHLQQRLHARLPLNLQVLTSDGCRLALGSNRDCHDGPTVVKLHVCLDRTGHVSFHIGWPDRKTCRTRAPVSWGFITTLGTKFPWVCVQGPGTWGGFPSYYIMSVWQTEGIRLGLRANGHTGSMFYLLV